MMMFSEVWRESSVLIIKYRLKFLPIFYQDLNSALTYVSRDLKNPNAAYDLFLDIEEALQRRLPFAESFEKYYSRKDREIPYYRIYVKSFVIYYVVYPEDDMSKIMEVRRLLYKGRDYIKII